MKWLALLGAVGTGAVGVLWYFKGQPGLPARSPTLVRFASAILSLVLLIAATYAASDEFHQSFTVGRHPSPVDVTIDSSGALIALAALALWLHYWRRYSSATGRPRMLKPPST